MAVSGSDLPTMIAEPEKGFANIDDIKVEDGTECRLPVEDGKTYVFPECGHFICEECLIVARGGKIENINVGDVENFQRRRCGVCNKRFRFGSGKLKSYRAYYSSV